MTENGSNAYLCKRYPSLAVFLARGLNWGRVSTLFSQHLARYEYHDLPELSFSDVELLSGCCMFASTNALQRAGGFDDHFFLYFEDFDLSLRMKAEGRVVFLPASSIVHLGGNSATKGLHHIRLFVQSGLRFFRKHGWKII
jgi:GT2 family glycosyltransferase